MTKGQPNKLEGNGIGGIDISHPTNVEKRLPVVKFGQCEEHVSGGGKTPSAGCWPPVQAGGGGLRNAAHTTCLPLDGLYSALLSPKNVVMTSLARSAWFSVLSRNPALFLTHLFFIDPF